MKLTLFAATGRIGRHILDQASAAGHEVTAVVRNPAGLADAPVRTVRADLAVAGPADLAPAIEGADAVLSGLGRRKKGDTGIVAPGTEAIVRAMKLTDTRRLVVVSAVPVYTMPSRGRPDPPKHDPADGFFLRTVATPLVKALFHTSYVDLAAMEDVLRDSGLDWTVVRPPRLTNRKRTGHYRTERGQNVRHGRFIGRADVADFMLAVLDQPETIGQAMGIAYQPSHSDVSGGRGWSGVQAVLHGPIADAKSADRQRARPAAGRPLAGPVQLRRGHRHRRARRRRANPSARRAGLRPEGPACSSSPAAMRCSKPRAAAPTTTSRHRPGSGAPAGVL